MGKRAKVEKQAKKILHEFKEFISRGSVIDLSIGLIMGTAFTAIVNSLVKEIFMPLFSMLISGIDFTHWKIMLKDGTEGSADPATGLITDKSAEIAITFGNFIQQVINFLILGLIVFIMVKAINKFRNRTDAEAKAEAEKQAPQVSEEILILREIRDLLKEPQNASLGIRSTSSDNIE